MKRLCLLLILTVNLQRLSIAQTASYWQQDVDYLIHVTLDDLNHTLQGDITITYTNNSPDELSFIWFHLWPNAYKNTHTAFAKQKQESGSIDFYASKPEERGFIDQLDFKVNGSAVKLEYDPVNIDIAKITLNTPLASGESITITTPFHVKIPRTFSRLGHDGQLYQITQWYPKPAVYDRKGWHPIPYLDQGEFYSEFGDFHVFITLPENYVVGASGDLQTASEIQFLDQLAEASKNASYVAADLDFPPSSSTNKTIEYKLANAHDFAWFADKRFHVAKSSVVLPESERVVTTYVYFGNKHAKTWVKACDYVNRAVLFYSDKVGEYPWNVAQALDGTLEVEGAGGMEYPTITVLAGGFDAQALDVVITHEVGHNWFYGILGFNERDYPWMDEGINTYYENRYTETYYTDRTLFGVPSPVAEFLGVEDGDPDDLLWAVNSSIANQNKAQPVQLHAAAYAPINYGLFVYAQTGYDFRYLADVLGQDEFDRVMRKFYKEWKFKHPQPEDMKSHFEKETGESFSWFFDKLITDDHFTDYRISKFQKGKSAMAADIENLSEIPASFSVSLMDGDSVLRTDWFRGFTGSQTIFFNYKPDWHVTHLIIDRQRTIPESNRENNTVKTEGLFKTLEPLQIKSGFRLDNPDRTTISYSPVIAWNDNDRWMPGIAVWNSTLTTPMFEYVLAPMYGITNNEWVGQGSVGINLYPEEGFISRLRVSEFVKRYSYDEFHVITLEDELKETSQYLKFESKAEIDFRKKKFSSKISQHARLRYTNIREEIVGYLFDDLGQILPFDGSYAVYDATYMLDNKQLLFPHSLSVTYQSVAGFSKLFSEFRIKVNYPKSKSGVSVRLFGGIWLSDPALADYGFTLAGTSGPYDYAYDVMYLGRNNNEGFLSRQIAMQDGFFKVPAYSSDFTADEFLAAANFEFQVPKLPIAVFADLGYMGKSITTSEMDDLQYDAGVMVRLANDVIEFYFPLLMSDNLEEQFPDGTKYGEKISFLLNLNALNLFELMRKLEL